MLFSVENIFQRHFQQSSDTHLVFAPTPKGILETLLTGSAGNKNNLNGLPRMWLIECSSNHLSGLLWMSLYFWNIFCGLFPWWYVEKIQLFHLHLVTEKKCRVQERMPNRSGVGFLANKYFGYSGMMSAGFHLEKKCIFLLSDGWNYMTWASGHVIPHLR